MKTVKVRIAVAVESSGEWSAYGLSGWSDEHALNKARLHVSSLSSTNFVTAELPVPEQVDVEGEVEEVSK